MGREKTESCAKYNLLLGDRKGKSHENANTRGQCGDTTGSSPQAPWCSSAPSYWVWASNERGLVCFGEVTLEFQLPPLTWPVLVVAAISAMSQQTDSYSFSLPHFLPPSLSVALPFNQIFKTIFMRRAWPCVLCQCYFHCRETLTFSQESIINEFPTLRQNGQVLCMLLALGWKNKTFRR